VLAGPQIVAKKMRAPVRAPSIHPEFAIVLFRFLLVVIFVLILLPIVWSRSLLRTVLLRRPATVCGRRSVGSLSWRRNLRPCGFVRRGLPRTSIRLL
jgi:hypothetical protein